MKQKHQDRNMSILLAIKNAGLLIVLSLGFSSAAQACSVPVFRYALERWPADAYRLVIFHNGPLSAEQQTERDYLESRCEMEYSRPSLALYGVDVNESIPEPLVPIWETVRDTPQPCMILLPPVAAGGEIMLWTASLSRDRIDELVDSPVRRELARRLITGQTAVWLVLQSGDTQRDEAVTEVLAAGLQQMEAEQKLPHELDPNDTQYDTALSEGIELKLDYSILPVNLNDPCEILLASVFKDMVTVDGESILPLVVPVFGRARALVFLEAADVDTDSIADICHFLVGPCSCQVKQMNPGVDLPVLVDWDARIVSVMEEKETPIALVGLGAALSSNVNESQTGMDDMNDVDVISKADVQNAPKVLAETPNQMLRCLGGLIILMLVIIVVGSVVIVKMKHEK